jgi:hypothetical protein
MPVSTDRHKPQRNHTVAAAPARESEPSPRWYAAVMLSLIAAGVLVVAVNYMGLLPGGHNHNYIYLGAGGIAAGLLMALRCR